MTRVLAGCAGVFMLSVLMVLAANEGEARTRGRRLAMALDTVQQVAGAAAIVSATVGAIGAALWLLVRAFG